jgi:hypothetical protein
MGFTVSAKSKKALLAACIGALSGCELVAGIQDLQLSNQGDASIRDAGASDSTSPADGPAAAQPPDADAAAGDDAHQPPSDATLAGDARDVAAAAIDVAPEVAPTDGAIDVGSSAAPDGSDAAMTEGAADSATDSPLDAGVVVTELIDDMEGQTGSIALSNGRAGYWHVYQDLGDGGALTPAPGGPPSGVISAISPARGASMFAAHIQGSGFAMFAGMGFDMVDLAGAKKVYDASAYRGFTFWGRSATGPLSVRMLVPDVNTDSTGGICMPCGDNFGTNIVLTTAWQQYFVYYTDLRQVGFGHPNANDDGGPGALAAAQLYGCQFQVSAPASTPAFDVWIDDVYFIK